MFYCAGKLNRVGKSNPIITHVEFRVESTEKHVTKNPDKTRRWGDILSSKATQISYFASVDIWVLDS